MIKTKEKLVAKSNIKIPFYPIGASCGFPSPADDFAENSLDLNDYLIDHPASSFFVRAKGNSMINAGILDGDLLIIDKSLNPKNNSIVLACLDGEFLIKKFVQKDGKVILQACNPEFKDIDVSQKEGFSIEGIVIAVIHKY